MNAGLVCVLPPDRVIGLHIDHLHTVQCHNIKVADRFVVLRRISGGNNDPALRHLLVSEGLALKKLQHRRGKCLGYAVDLIDEQYSL